MGILEKECEECINLFGYDETRCAFCKDKEWYKMYLVENEELKL